MEKQLIRILKNFKVNGAGYSFQTINNGYINDTYLVLQDENPVYILQRINHLVFKNIDGVMNNIAKALSILQSDTYGKIDLISTLKDESYHSEDGFWRLMSFIDGTTTYNTTTDSKIAYEAGRIIAEFHKLLQNEKKSDYVDTIPKFHDLELRKNQFNSALGSANKERLTKAKSSIGFAKKLLPRLLEFSSKKHPLRVCHMDTKLNNILFSKTNQKAVCLIDLDTIMRGHLYHDFGDALRTIVNTAPEDERDLNKIVFDKKLFEAFVEGLATNASIFTKEEFESLSLGAVFMPFIHGLRALTDYLENDKYYKTAYEDQNIDRCISLFNFADKALDNEDFMNKVLEQKLKV